MREPLTTFPVPNGITNNWTDDAKLVQRSTLINYGKSQTKRVGYLMMQLRFESLRIFIHLKHTDTHTPRNSFI